MKILIAGSRTILNFNLEEYIPQNTELIISGGANGIDRLAEQYADQHKISKLIIYPQYHKYGRAAPIKRNETMVDLCDMVLIIWDGISKGTKHTINYAKKKNKILMVILYNKNNPVVFEKDP